MKVKLRSNTTIKAFLTLICIFVCAIVFSSCGVFYSNTLAQPITIPEQIEHIEIGHFPSKRSISEFTEQEFSWLTTIIKNATPTKIQSNNDSPGKKEYYTVDLIGQNSFVRVYLYKDNSLFSNHSWYLEQPYSGVYEITDDSAQKIIEISKL